MTISTALWAWPQWTVLALIFARFAIHATRHGQERLETAGERKGKPERYSGFSSLSACAIWLFVLICGGFFK